MTVSNLYQNVILKPKLENDIGTPRRNMSMTVTKLYIIINPF